MIPKSELHPPSPFWVIVEKEIREHTRSWRFGILLFLITLACIGSLYTAIMAIRNGVIQDEGTSEFLFLSMFTISDGTLPNFTTFVSFLGPLIGIALGFDAINAERSKGTLSRLISQPIYRDDFILSKFTAGILLISIVIFSLGFLVMGLGLLTIGYPPTPEEFGRIILFMLIAIVYIGFWLNLSLLCSVRFRQAATSALSCIACWLFFSLFYGMIVNLIASSLFGSWTDDLLQQQRWTLLLNRLSPAELFSDATMTMLMPNVRTLGPVTMEQIYGAIPAPLPLGQSMLLVWPQITSLIAATAICFGITYAWFMRQEIRSRA